MGKNAVETYIHMLLITFATVIGVCFIALSMQHSMAQKVHASIIKDIEASHFSEQVISEKIAEVNDPDGVYQKSLPGCSLSVRSVRTGGVVESPNDVINETAEVTLTYYYDAFIFIKPLEYVLTGYAR